MDFALLDEVKRGWRVSRHAAVKNTGEGRMKRRHGERENGDREKIEDSEGY